MLLCCLLSEIEVLLNRISSQAKGRTINDLGEAWAKSRKKNYSSAREEKKSIGKRNHSAAGPGRKLMVNFMLGCYTVNMDIHSFSIQFIYKPSMNLRRPHAKSREKKEITGKFHPGLSKIPAPVGLQEVMLFSRAFTPQTIGMCRLGSK